MIAFLSGLILFLMIFIGIAAFAIRDKLGLQERQRDVLLKIIVKFFSGYPYVFDFICLSLLAVLLSTIDSFLHALGIVFTQDILNPMSTLWYQKPLDSHQKVVTSKILILLVGICSIAMGAFGKSLLFYTNAVLLSGFLLPPLIIGIFGLKTDIISWGSYVAGYAISLYVFRSLSWHRYDYFPFSLLFGLVAYLISHIFLNRGIATVERGENYTSMGIWYPQRASLQTSIKKRLKAVFNIAQQARQEVVQRPSHALTFSIVMFVLYAVDSGFGVSNYEETVNFTTFIYLVGISLCVGLMLEGVWSFALKPYFPLYWFVTLFFCLPLRGSLAFMRVHEGFSHITIFWASFLLLAFLVSSHVFLWMTFLGMALAWAGWYVTHGHMPAFIFHEVYVWGYIGLAVLTLFVSVFGYYFEVYMAQQIYLKQVLGHAVTHESRQPLTEISLLSSIQEKAMKGLTPIESKGGEKGFFIPEKNLTSMERGSEQIKAAIADIQSELIRFRKVMGEEISQIPPEKVGMQSLIQKILPTLPRRRTSAIKVVVECKKDFEAMVTRAFFPNVLVNLLNNAYLHGGAKEMKIVIDGIERKLRIRDNGQGISKTVLPSIFKFRFTTGGEVNEGIGLALVKLILNASGTKIDCISKQGEGSFTEFVLTFPRVNKA